MRLAIDVGNNSIKWGMGSPDSLVAVGHVPTHDPNVIQKLKFSLMERSWDFDNEAFGVSVVPTLRANVAAAVPGIKWLESYEAQFLKINYQQREKLGADRVANAFAMLHAGIFPAICVDLGTATNIDVMDIAGNFVGGVIMPGPETAANALLKDAAMLDSIDWEVLPKSIGSSTTECLQIGCVKVYKMGLEAIVNSIAFELGQAPKIVVTGGLSRTAFAPMRQDMVDTSFTLKGVLAWAERYV